MRWQALFDDLEADLALAERAERQSQAADLMRAEWAGTTLGERLAAGPGRRVSVRLSDGLTVGGELVDTAPSWLLLRDQSGEILVPASAVAAVCGLDRAVAPAAGHVARRLGMGHALRALSRGRVFVRMRTAGTELGGTIDRVGADHCDLATHDVDQWRRPQHVSGVWTVRFDQLVCVRSHR